MWTCRNCKQRWTNGKLRCSCGRKAPKRKPTQRQMRQAISYEELVERFGEVCMICGTGPGATRLHRDHDHATGRARGLLCFPCNRHLGHWYTADWLRKAADYLDAADRARV